MAEIQLINNCEAEQTVLTCCLGSDISYVADALRVLKVNDFYRLGHQYIFNAIKELYYKQQSTDPIMVAHYLDAQGLLKDIGGKSYLIDLHSRSFSFLLFETHLYLVKELSLQRLITKTTSSIAEASSKPQIDFDEFLNSCEEKLRALLEKMSSAKDV